MSNELIKINNVDFSTKIKIKDFFESFKNGVLTGILSFIFILLIFYFISLVRFRRPKCT